jgi:methylated-DNA-[protein]-cysteine S-methyltransferase
MLGYSGSAKIATGAEEMDSKNFVRYYHSPIVGWLRLQVSPKAVRSIDFVSDPYPDDSPETNAIMVALIKELDLYFNGKCKSFSVPLEPEEGTPFQRKVWRELTRIPYGETRSYGEVAAAVGNPRGARAVGLANKNNCIPILIPCHRVIKSDGGLGGFDSGLDKKRALLRLEGVEMEDQPELA